MAYTVRHLCHSQVTSLPLRSFANTDRLYKYALDKHKKTVGQGKLLDKVRFYDKDTLEGLNEFNTDYTKSHGKKPKEKLKPIQHPKLIDSTDTNIIPHTVPAKNLTPYEHIPYDALAQLNLPNTDSPMGARFLQACFLGAPNAGKSSLVNSLVHKNVSAVSNKFNTTDEATTGIYTDIPTKTQLALVDTPGATKANNSMRNKLLVTKAWNEIDNADQVVFVVDAAKRLSFEVKEALIRLRKTADRIDP